MNKPKILLIDDNSELCDGLAEAIRAEGYLVDNTSDSEEAAALIKKNKYHAGIFDYKMRGLNGIDLLKIMKSVDPQCSVFMITAMSSIHALLAEEKVGDLVAGVLKKPFNIEELIQEIKSIEFAELRSKKKRGGGKLKL